METPEYKFLIGLRGNKWIVIMETKNLTANVANIYGIGDNAMILFNDIIHIKIGSIVQEFWWNEETHTYL